MVEYSIRLDHIFGSLADATRRDILKRVAKKSMTISEIARHYKLTFAAISKHLKILEKAKLVIKQRRGKEQVVQLAPAALNDVTKYVENCKKLWESRLDLLEDYLKTMS